MKGLLKEIFALKFNKVLTMQKSKTIINNLILVAQMKSSRLAYQYSFSGQILKLDYETLQPG